MPGKKSRFTKKQDKQADHIIEGYQKKGMSKKQASSIAYATLNKQKFSKKKKSSKKGKK